jgi:hypothetical protein
MFDPLVLRMFLKWAIAFLSSNKEAPEATPPLPQTEANSTKQRQRIADTCSLNVLQEIIPEQWTSLQLLMVDVVPSKGSSEADVHEMLVVCRCCATLPYIILDPVFRGDNGAPSSSSI